MNGGACVKAGITTTTQYVGKTRDQTAVSDRVDSVEKRQKQFFVKCAQDKKWKQSDREEEYNRIRKEYHKVIEEAGEKVNLAEESYSLVDKYMRKLDQELLKFKLELEADNRGQA